MRRGRGRVDEGGKRRLTSGQRALTNSMLCEMMQTAPPQSRIATERPPRASRSKLKRRNARKNESASFSSDLRSFDGVRSDSQVGRLIENEDLGVVPKGGGDDDLDLLSSGESLDLGVHGVVSLESDVLEVLLDEVSGVVSGSGSL